jgi:hypothetical protein
MRQKILLSLVAVLSIINGTAYLFFAPFSISFLGGYPTSFSVLITRYYGACALGYGILLWLLKRSDSAVSIQAAILSIPVVLIPSAIIGLLGTLAGVINSLGWLFILTDISLSVWAVCLWQFDRN